MKIFYPKNTLAIAMKAAEPMLAQTALGRAETGLAAIRSQCLAQLDELLAELDAPADAGVDVRGRLKRTYDASRRIIGLGHVAGFPQIDMGALSLCDVADGILAREQVDWAPIAAHIDAMRLMRHPDLPNSAITMLLESLDTLRERFSFAAS